MMLIDVNCLLTSMCDVTQPPVRTTEHPRVVKVTITPQRECMCVCVCVCVCVVWRGVGLEGWDGEVLRAPVTSVACLHAVFTNSISQKSIKKGFYPFFYSVCKQTN